jgi:hypothetical protein
MTPARPHPRSPTSAIRRVAVQVFAWGCELVFCFVPVLERLHLMGAALSRDE